MLRILLICALLASPAAFAKTFKIATISPDGLSWMKKLRAGTKEIQEKTDGRIKFKIYPGGVQGDDFTVLRKMRIGQLQGGAVAASTLTRFYPDLQIYNLPLKFWKLDEVDYVRARMDQRIIDGLDKAGIVSFTLAETGFAYVMSTKPVRSLDELRNVKAWVPDGDPISAQLIQSFGISPIPLYVSDVLAGLQTGLIDAVAVPPIVALALQWHNQLKYMINVPLVYIYSLMMLDKKAFESISPEDQKVVRTVMNRVFREIDQDNRKDSRAAYKALVDQGIKVIQFDSNQMVDWREQAEDSIEGLVKSDQISQESLQLLNRYLAEARETGAAQQTTSSD
jgi:TRAP-type C4-dicarboxylate transport system substrate-binding protein